MPNKDEEARKLAEAHYRVEVGITRIFRIAGTAETESRSDEPIKLLEVSQSTIPCGVLPLQFGPAPASGNNCEYPWEDADTQLHVPLDWTFVPSGLLTAPAGRTFLKLVHAAIASLLEGLPSGVR